MKKIMLIKQFKKKRERNNNILSWESLLPKSENIKDFGLLL